MLPTLEKHYWEFLGSFWRDYEDKSVLEAYWEAILRLAGDLREQAKAISRNSSIETATSYITELEAMFEFSAATVLGYGLDLEFPYLFRIPEDVEAIPSLHDLRDSSSVALLSGTDYKLYQSAIAFRVDPRPRIPAKKLDRPGYVRDTVYLHCPKISRFTDALYKNFAEIVGYKNTRTSDYRLRVSILLKALMYGPTEFGLANLAALLFSPPEATPLTLAAGKARSYSEDRHYTYLRVGTMKYAFPKFLYGDLHQLRSWVSENATTQRSVPAQIFLKTPARLFSPKFDPGYFSGSSPIGYGRQIIAGDKIQKSGYLFGTLDSGEKWDTGDVWILPGEHNATGSEEIQAGGQYFPRLDSIVPFRKRTEVIRMDGTIRMNTGARMNETRTTYRLPEATLNTLYESLPKHHAVVEVDSRALRRTVLNNSQYPSILGPMSIITRTFMTGYIFHPVVDGMEKELTDEDTEETSLLYSAHWSKDVPADADKALSIAPDFYDPEHDYIQPPDVVQAVSIFDEIDSPGEQAAVTTRNTVKEEISLSFSNTVKIYATYKTGTTIRMDDSIHFLDPVLDNPRRMNEELPYSLDRTSLVVRAS